MFKTIERDNSKSKEIKEIKELDFLSQDAHLLMHIRMRSWERWLGRAGPEAGRPRVAARHHMNNTE